MSGWQNPRSNPMIILPPTIDRSAEAPDVPLLEEWNPAGDAYLPDDEGAELYAPPSERVPAQDPPVTARSRPLEFLAQQWDVQRGTGAADLGPKALGFNAHTVQVDNLSSKWVFIPSLGRYVPPSTVGTVLRIHGGTQVGHVRIQTPPGHADGAVGSSAGDVVATWFEEYLSPAPGVAAAS